MNIRRKTAFLVNFTYYSVIAVIAFLVFRFLMAYLFPFVIGIILVYVLNRPSEYLSVKLKIPKNVCAPVLVTVTYALLITVIGLAVWFAVGNLPTITKKIPSFVDAAAELLSDIKNKFGYDGKGAMSMFFTSSLNSIRERVSESASSYATTTIKSLPGILISSVVTVVASCYIARDYDRLKKFLKNMMSEKAYKNTVTLKTILTDSVLKFLLGYLLIMFITFAELSVGLLILKVDYAILFAALISLVDLLPVLGTGTVMVPWAIIAVIYGKTGFGIGLLIIYAVITVVRNFIEPKIIGRRIGISPLLTLAAMFAGLKIAGVLGLIALPVTVMVVIDYYKLQLRNESDEDTMSKGNESA